MCQIPLQQLHPCKCDHWPTELGDLIQAQVAQTGWWICTATLVILPSTVANLTARTRSSILLPCLPFVLFYLWSDSHICVKNVKIPNEGFSLISKLKPPAFVHHGQSCNNKTLGYNIKHCVDVFYHRDPNWSWGWNERWGKTSSENKSSRRVAAVCSLRAAQQEVEWSCSHDLQTVSPAQAASSISNLACIATGPMKSTVCTSEISLIAHAHSPENSYLNQNLCVNGVTWAHTNTQLKSLRGFIQLLLQSVLWRCSSAISWTLSVRWLSAVSCRGTFRDQY